MLLEIAVLLWILMTNARAVLCFMLANYMQIIVQDVTKC